MAGRFAYIAVYIMADGARGTLYVGSTNDLPRRVYEHREGLLEGFTKTYGCTRLVWYEPHDLMTYAIQRERTLKHYVREWKINLIERENPLWQDLYPSLV